MRTWLLLSIRVCVCSHRLIINLLRNTNILFVKLVGVGQVSVLYDLWSNVILPDRLRAEWLPSVVFGDEQGYDATVHSATE